MYFNAIRENKILAKIPESTVFGNTYWQKHKTIHLLRSVSTVVNTKSTESETFYLSKVRIKYIIQASLTIFL